MHYNAFLHLGVEYFSFRGFDRTPQKPPPPQVRRRNVIVNVVCPIVVFITVFFTGLPSFAPAISFLKGAGQGHIVNQVNVVLEVLMFSILCDRLFHPNTASLVSARQNKTR